MKPDERAVLARYRMLKRRRHAEQRMWQRRGYRTKTENGLLLCETDYGGAKTFVPAWMVVHYIDQKKNHLKKRRPI